MLITGFFLLKGNFSGEQIANQQLLKNVDITVYKSPTCGCCGKYIAYLKNNGANVIVEETEEMNAIKTKYNIPSLLESCHTSVIGDYVVEGHVPVEAIRRLLDEKPLIAGISLPEMPAGSPGMGGTKLVPFGIHTITIDGNDGGIFIEV